jgi:ketosteroid isomerase-like protein
LPGSTPDGVEESALLQIEQDWLNAFAKSDVAALERILAKEWAENADGQVDTRTQAIVDIKNGAYKIESVKMSNFSAHVLGDAAVVTTTVDIKGKYKKNDVSGRERSYDFFVKRDGRWQAIGTQNTSIK